MQLFEYWGKAKHDEGEGPSWHPVVYHSLDVASVGEVYLEKHPSLLSFFSKELNVPPDLIQSWLRYLLLIHDLGKFSHAFQGQKPDLVESITGVCPAPSGYETRHDTLGYMAWSHWGREEVSAFQIPEGIKKRSWDKHWSQWVKASCGHHGMPPEENPTNVLGMKLHFTEEDEKNIKDYLLQIKKITEDHSVWQPGEDFLKQSRRLSWWIAGLSVLCDWIGSNRSHFPFQAPGQTIEEYWDSALEKADAAILNTGVLPTKSAPRKSFKELFTGLSVLQPRPLQGFCQDSEVPNQPQLFILEDLTGSGKTESALLLANRLLSAQAVNGIYFALPTMATANAMFLRLGTMYQRLFEGTPHPSIVLAHSGRSLSDVFRSSIFRPGPEEKDYSREDASGTTRCNAWFADNRKKALLGQVGVGTVDQALTSVLHSKHQSLRLCGLFRKLLIVDEVHANDSYMHSLLRSLLEFQGASGGSVVLMSATLPERMKRELIESFRQGLSKETPPLTFNTAYPLVTHLSGSSIQQTPIEATRQLKRKFRVEWFDEVSDVTGFLVETALRGESACWIRNTVQEARTGYLELINEFQAKGMEPSRVALFHARFMMGDRLKTEEETLRQFGKESDSDLRKGRILVATQVVEQSLDLDFDQMVTDLAPVDLIIQRAGRLRRHLRDSRGNRKEKGEDGRGETILHVFGPAESSEIESNWYSSFSRGSAFIYPDHGEIWRTVSVLKEKGHIQLPEDSRWLVEEVFGEHAREIPEALDASSSRVEGQHNANRQMAQFNSINLDQGYSREGFDWWDDSYTPTRLGEPSQTVELLILRDQKLVPFFSADASPALSQLTLPQRDALREFPCQDRLDEQRLSAYRESTPGRGRWILYVILQQVQEGLYSGKIINQREEPESIFYDVELGVLTERQFQQIRS